MAGKLIDIFQNCKCVKEEKHLAAGEVRSLAFGDNNTVMVVELGLHEVVSRKVIARAEKQIADTYGCLLYTSPSPRDLSTSRMPSSA